MTNLILSEGEKVVLVLLLSLLIGLEREEHKDGNTEGYSFGGIRTFPLIGLTGYSIALLTQAQPLAILLGLMVIGAFMYASYQHKLTVLKNAGLTSEVSGLFTYLLGALVFKEYYWLATTLVVIGLLLLGLKNGLEGLAKRIPQNEIVTFTKFLLLSVVILPVLPNTPLTPFNINPFKGWLVVVAISGLSYGSYMLQRIFRFPGAERSMLTLALVGGAYSSTVATCALAKRSNEAKSLPQLFSGATLAASGVMYFRIAILVSIFSTALRMKLLLPFLALGSIAIVSGILWASRAGKLAARSGDRVQTKNPLELSAAFAFAALFLGMQILTGFVLTHLGSMGLYSLSVITGITDVDPFIMGLTQTAGAATPVEIAAIAIVIAAASNNLVKGFYALAFSDKKAGRQSFALLALLAALGLIPAFLLG